MPMADLGGLGLHYRQEGDPGGPPLVLIHALGTDLDLFEPALPFLPKGLNVLRFSLRGHGLSDTPPPPYGMGALVKDTEALMDHLGLRDAVVAGVSIGGMVAQGLAVKRLDLVRGLVLSNTAAKIGTAEMWGQRIEAVKAGGIAAVAGATLERWFPPAFRSTPPARLARNRLERTPLDGWIGCAAAIAGTDFYSTTAGLRLPVLGIAGTEDGSTPPDLVRETTDLVPGSRFALLRGAGHLPCIDAPEGWAGAVADFLREIGHC